jgi:Ca2+-binding EF-hand superfamily protein
LLLYLRQYYEYWVAFDRVDLDNDRRISRQEFNKALPVMKDWAIDVSNPDALWREADSDGHGMILFIEFADWAIKK